MCRLEDRATSTDALRSVGRSVSRSVGQSASRSCARGVPLYDCRMPFRTINAALVTGFIAGWSTATPVAAQSPRFEVTVSSAAGAKPVTGRLVVVVARDSEPGAPLPDLAVGRPRCSRWTSTRLRPEPPTVVDGDRARISRRLSAISRREVLGAGGGERLPARHPLRRPHHLGPVQRRTPGAVPGGGRQPVQHAGGGGAPPGRHDPHHASTRSCPKDPDPGRHRVGTLLQDPEPADSAPSGADRSSSTRRRCCRAATRPRPSTALSPPSTPSATTCRSDSRPIPPGCGDAGRSAR